MAINKSDNEEKSNHPACAACKYQRKRCRPDCILSRHFPANRAADFKTVQKIFGVKSLIKMVSEVNPEERDEVVNSLYWEGAMWAQDPVRGPYGYYRRVKDELDKYQRSLQHTTVVLPNTTSQINGYFPQPNNTSFDGNMINGSSVMDSRVVNSYARPGGGLPYPYRAVGAVQSRFLQNQQVGRNTTPFYSPHVRLQINNGLSTHQNISNGQWSRGQVNEGFGSGSNGPNHAINQGLHVNEAICQQQNYVHSQHHNNCLPDEREESCEEN